MKDDPESVKIRIEHQKWMELHGFAKETLDMAETGRFPKWFVQFVAWLFRIVCKCEDIARREARKTYQKDEP